MTYLLLEYYVCLKGHNRSKNVTRKDKNGGGKKYGWNSFHIRNE